MKKVQYNKIADNKTNQSSINSNNGSNTLLGILLHRLELTGLFKGFVVRTSLGRCSSMVRSNFVFSTFSILALAFILSLFSILTTTSNTHAASLTMSIDQAPVINLMPKTATGDFAKSSDSTISVTTDYSSGYTLGITASSSTDLVNSSDNTKVMSSISSATSENDFKASSNGDTYNNKWGYLLSKLNSTANTSFLPSPSTTEGDIIDVTDAANSVANTYTLAIGARANLDTPVGAYSNTFVISAVANVSFLTINYNANNSYTGSSAYFGSDTSSLVNTIDYDAQYTQVEMTEAYSHTPNISDDGTVNDTYDNTLGLSQNTNEIITIPGASKLGITITYQTEGDDWDWTSFWAGSYPSYTAESNYSTGVECDGNTSGKYGGETKTTKTCEIDGDTVTFSFHNDDYEETDIGTYGYYAVITGYDTNGDVVPYYKYSYTKTAETGTYTAPTVPSGMNFVGWATTDNATTAEYTSESDISTGLAKINGDDPVTLYPVYTSNVTIKTATGISMVYIREVGSSTDLCTTYSTSGTVCALTTGKTYNLYASLSSGYSFSSWTKSGVGTLSSTTAYNPVTFTVGMGATTLTPSTTPNEYNITVNFVGGVSSVAFNNSTYGSQTVSTSGSTIKLRYNQRYNMTVTLASGYQFLSWEKTSGSGTLGSTSTMNTYFTPSAGSATLKITTASAQIKTADGIDSVTVSTTGGSTVCTVTNTTGTYCSLTMGTTYNITATTHQGYTFSSWSNTGNGTIGSATSSTTTFTPAQSSAIDIITPSATGNPYTVTIVFGNEHVSSVTVDGETFTTSGGTKTLTAGTAYTISGTTDLNVVSFTSSANGVVAGSTFTLYGDATLTAEGSSKIYIQDLTLANCPAEGMTVYDKRDENDYTVKLINGQCWMTQNLRYLGDTGSVAGTMTIGNNYSNVANKDITLYSLNSSNTGNFGAFSGHCAYYNTGFNNACVYDSGSTSTGVWYNYFAATAGTISTYSNTTAATSDICPAGWHLPSGPSTIANTDYNKLVGNTTNGWQAATSGLTAFSAVAGGRYYDGSFGNDQYGIWCSTTTHASDTMLRYCLYYDSSNGQFNGGSAFGRGGGYFVRCVRSS